MVLEVHVGGLSGTRSSGVESGVIFTKRLREGVRRGEITCSIRIWQRPRVSVGKRYRMEDGEIEVDSILPISLADITPALARESGFKGVVDLLKVAKHGEGENVYLVRFHFVPLESAPRRANVRARQIGPSASDSSAKAVRVRASEGSGKHRRRTRRTSSLR
jgi:hypothetical protein